MARRRRRGRFKRVKPDMGWWTSKENLSFSGALGVKLDMATVFDFNDINNDNVLITQDKSDWFIKRVLLDVFPVLGRTVSQTSGPARVWEFAVGTMDSARAGALVASPQYITDPDTYEQWRRLFRTYVKPVYATWEVGKATGSNNRLLVNTVDTAFQNEVADSPWGLSAIHDDFTVSNAGLVDDTALYVAISNSDTNPSTRYEWAAGDTLNVGIAIRVLLQKRRT